MVRVASGLSGAREGAPTLGIAAEREENADKEKKIVTSRKNAKVKATSFLCEGQSAIDVGEVQQRILQLAATMDELSLFAQSVGLAADQSIGREHRRGCRVAAEQECANLIAMAPEQPRLRRRDRREGKELRLKGEKRILPTLPLSDDLRMSG